MEGMDFDGRGSLIAVIHPRETEDLSEGEGRKSKVKTLQLPLQLRVAA